nr:hypothetical protein [Chthoniobacter flavus]
MMRNGARGAVLVGCRNVDENFALGADGFLVGRERFVIAAEDFAVRQFHREHEILALRIAEVGEVFLRAVFGSDGELTVAFRAGILGIGLDSVHGQSREADEGDERKKNAERISEGALHGGRYAGNRLAGQCRDFLEPRPGSF